MTNWRPSGELLFHMYSVEKMSTREIADEIAVSQTSLRAWMRKAGIAMRSISDAKKGRKPSSATINATVASRRKRVLPCRPNVGYKLRSDGYVCVMRRGHPNATSEGYVLEHRLVMSELLGRPLRDYEDVHHIDGNRSNNDPANLELVRHTEHLREHYSSRVIDRANGRFLKK